MHRGKSTVECPAVQSPFPVFDKPAQGTNTRSPHNVGDPLRTLDATTTPVESIAFVQERVPVYNFEVGKDHAYYVARARVLVHNGCGSGRHGGQLHLDKIREKSDELLADGWDVRSATSGGEKGILIDGKMRFPDIWARKNGRNIAINIGKMRLDDRPVLREFPALFDLETVFDEVHFYAYNR